MKKKFFLCLIEIVSLTCMGHAAGLPVLPLPKVISTVDGANKGEKVYGFHMAKDKSGALQLCAGGI